jgi:hypothetical protein
MTTYTRKIGQRGSGLWIRIPSAKVREMNLKVGGKVETVGAGENNFELRCATGHDAAETQEPGWPNQ